MPDRREEIIFPILKKPEYSYDDNIPIAAIKEAMDEYMKSCCLDLLQFLSDNKVECGTSKDGPIFWYAGEYLTKEQLFENFL